jgi:hypothetical protein
MSPRYETFANCQKPNNSVQNLVRESRRESSALMPLVIDNTGIYDVHDSLEEIGLTSIPKQTQKSVSPDIVYQESKKRADTVYNNDQLRPQDL